MKKVIVVFFLIFLMLSGCAVQKATVNTYIDPAYHSGTINRIAVFPMKNTKFAPSEARQINRKISIALKQKNPQMQIMSSVEAIKKISEHNLAKEWAALERKRPLSEKYQNQSISTLNRFTAFVCREDCHIQDLLEVSRTHIKKFMDSEDKRGITPRTWNYTLTLLKGAFSKLEPHSAAYTDYLAKTPLHDLATVHREPFSQEELKTIIQADIESIAHHGKYGEDNHCFERIHIRPP